MRDIKCAGPRPPGAPGRRPGHGLSLVEVLVVLAVIGVLMSLLLPALGAVRRQAHATECMSNMRQLGAAHIMYMNVNRERFVTVGLPHGGAGDLKSSWLTKLPQVFHDSTEALRSPADRSPYWSVGDGGSWDGLTLRQALAQLDEEPTRPFTNSQISRWSSYAVNILLTDQFSGLEDDSGRFVKWTRLHHVPNPSATIHFLPLTEGWRHPNSDADFARSDHVDAPWALPPWGPFASASPEQIIQTHVIKEMEIGLHGGPTAGWPSEANYAFLDGRVANMKFQQVFVKPGENNFLPSAAK